MTDNYFKASDQVLTVDRTFRPKFTWESPRIFTYIFDFEFKTMTVVTNYGSSSTEKASVHPFPVVDKDLLERMRGKLVELGGNPAPLDHTSDQKTAFAAPAVLRRPGEGGKP